MGPTLVMKLNSMKPPNSSAESQGAAACSDSAARARPAAQPTKPAICSGMRPRRSDSSTAPITPTISSTSSIAAPFAATMSRAMMAATLWAWVMSWPTVRARMVGVKMPMP